MEDKRISDLDDAGKDDRFDRYLVQVKGIYSKYIFSNFSTFLDGEQSETEAEEDMHD